MPEPVVIEYRRAFDLGGFSRAVKVRAGSRNSGNVKVSFKVTCRNVGGKTGRKQIKVEK